MESNGPLNRIVVLGQSEIVNQLPVTGKPPELIDFINFMKAKAKAEKNTFKMTWQTGDTITVNPDSDPQQVYQEWKRKK